MNKIMKLYEYMKKNIFIISLILISLIYMVLNLYDIIYKFEEHQLIGHNYLYMYLVCSILITIVVFYIIFRLSKTKKINIPSLFVFLAILIGTPYIFLSPLFTGSDEHNHYYRIYEISNFEMITPTEEYVGSKLPNSLSKTFNVAGGSNVNINYKDIFTMSKVELDKEDVKQYGKEWSNSYNNTALYSPFTYIPHVLGFWVGKLFNLSPLIIGMIGRITNFICFIILGYLSLKIVPKAKLFYLIVLLSPNMLQLATTLSADAFTNGLVLLYTAIVFKHYYNKEILGKKDKWTISLLAILISLCKIVYIPVVCLLYFIPNKCYKNMKEKHIYSGILIFICIVLGLLWTKQTEPVFAIEYTKNPKQMEFVLGNIFEYFIIFLRTFSNYFFEFVECLFVGTRMYHSQLIMPSFISIIYIVLVIISFLKHDNKRNRPIKCNIMIWIIALLTIGLIGSAIYVQATAQYIALENPVIEGIQGRYFLPIVILLPFLIEIKNIKLKIKEQTIISICLVINLITYFYIMSQFMI